MAQYDRNILVPYLRDVCSVEILCSRIQKEINTTSNEIQSLKNTIGQRIIDPAPPVMSNDTENSDGGIIAFLLIFSVGFFVAVTPLWIIGIGIMLFGAFGVAMCMSDKSEEKERNEKSYKEEADRYSRVIKNNMIARGRVPQLQSRLVMKQADYKSLSSALSEAKKLRNEVYSVNIIPTKYRNYRCAYYLYDYFNTGRESDLDKIIQTLLLDEINQKLDRVIMQNEEILMNQRYQIALQEKQNAENRERNEAMLKQIVALEKNQELQLDYQNMIAKNQMVTNFFLASEYVRRNR